MRDIDKRLEALKKKLDPYKNTKDTREFVRHMKNIKAGEHEKGSTVAVPIKTDDGTGRHVEINTKGTEGAYKRIHLAKLHLMEGKGQDFSIAAQQLGNAYEEVSEYADKDLGRKVFLIADEVIPYKKVYSSILNRSVRYAERFADSKPDFARRMVALAELCEEKMKTLKTGPK